LAMEQLRLHRPDVPWLIPVRFDDCDIPEYDIGGGRTLASIQRADLFGKGYAENASRLVTTVLRILGPYPGAPSAASASLASPEPTGPARHPSHKIPPARFPRPQSGSRPAGSVSSTRERFRTHPYTVIAALAGLFTLTVTVLVWSPWKHIQGSTPPQAPPSKSGSTIPGISTPTPVPTSGIRWSNISSDSWHSFGIAHIVKAPNGVMRVIFNQQLSLENKWAGVVADIPRSCRYAIEMQARVVGQISSYGGYGIASGRLNAQSQPEGVAFQYDLGFSGYRVLTYPEDFQTPYQTASANLDSGWHQLLTIFSGSMIVYVDGRSVISQTVSQSCGVPIIRVWSATAEFRDIQIGKL
jgi:hypothetical protein